MIQIENILKIFFLTLPASFNALTGMRMIQILGDGEWAAVGFEKFQCPYGHEDDSNPTELISGMAQQNFLRCFNALTGMRMIQIARGKAMEKKA